MPKVHLIFWLCLALLGANSAHAQDSSDPAPAVAAEFAPATIPRSLTLPIAAAAADSVTTLIALNSANAVEANPLINTSPAGLLGLFALKLVIANWANELPPGAREYALKAMAGVWGGVSANNLAIILGSAGSAPLVWGLAAGVALYKWEGVRLAQEAEISTSVPTPEPTQ